MRTKFDSDLATRLMRYAAVDTQSCEDSDSVPSTAIQWDLARMLEQELIEIGASDVKLTDYGAVLATVPGTVSDAPTIGFCAHVDTAPQFAASGVKPRLHAEWPGTPITYPDSADLVLDPQVKPYLATKTGDDIITASGATLLGADDKAGIAIIMTLAEHLLNTPGLLHGAIRIAFTPDEEIGRGVHADLPDQFAVDFAYTLDGGPVGEIVYETFSADGAEVQIKGVSIHPGYAKDKMINALHLAAQVVNALDIDGQTPETTDGRAGFTHCTMIDGGSAEATLRFILRDFEQDDLDARGAALRAVCDDVMRNNPGADVACTIRKQYRNMRYWLQDDMTPVDLARAACEAEGIAVISKPIRGGTDGSQLTERGVPCPNIFTGMQEIHGPLEWISVQDMAAATRVCLKLVQKAAD